MTSKTNAVASKLSTARSKTDQRIELCGQLDELVRSGQVEKALEFCREHNMAPTKELLRMAK